MMSNLSNDQKRIGINLDRTILGSDGLDALFGLKAFAMAQREQGYHLYVLTSSEGDDDKVTSALEEHGLFKEISAGGFGFDKADLILTSKESCPGKLKELGLSHYIYESESLIPTADLDNDIQPILLGDGNGFSLADWTEMSNYFSWQHGLRSQTTSALTHIETIKEKGENFLYKLNTADGGAYILKHYHEDCQDTLGHLGTEYNHLTSLHKCGITETPVPLWHEGSRAIYTFLDAAPLNEVDEKDVEQLASILVRLDGKREELQNENIADAKDARLCFQDYIDALSNKWNKVMNACQRPDGPKDIMLFMMTDLEQLRQDNLNHFYLWCKRENWDKSEALPKEKRIFSPVDFGIHNTLKTQDGELRFLDFEQSGWDDPRPSFGRLFLQHRTRPGNEP